MYIYLCNDKYYNDLLFAYSCKIYENFRKYLQKYSKTKRAYAQSVIRKFYLPKIKINSFRSIQYDKCFMIKNDRCVCDYHNYACI